MHNNSSILCINTASGLTTRGTTMFMLNPTLPEATELQTW